MVARNASSGSSSHTAAASSSAELADLCGAGEVVYPHFCSRYPDWKEGMDSARGARTPDDLRNILARQVGHLRRSNAAFDAGAREEAERIASVAYILLFDGKSGTTSVLSQLGYRDEIPFVTSLRKQAFRLTAPLEHPVRYEPLINAQGSRFLSKLQLEDVPFVEWWDEVVFKSRQEFVLSRGDLIRSIRNQDGGGHVDQLLRNPSYIEMSSRGIRALSESNGRVNFTMHSGKQPESYLEGLLGIGPGLHWTAMRQIGWELNQTLTRAGLCEAG